MKIWILVLCALLHAPQTKVTFEEFTRTMEAALVDAGKLKAGQHLTPATLWKLQDRCIEKICAERAKLQQ